MHVIQNQSSRNRCLATTMHAILCENNNWMEYKWDINKSSVKNYSYMRVFDPDQKVTYWFVGGNLLCLNVQNLKIIMKK